MSNYKFILSGGGTGGHIYPAIAIANELKSRYPNAEFLFVGAKDKMEMEKVPQAGYKIKGLWISGLQRKLTFKNLMFPIKLINSMIEARKIVRTFKPDMAIGTGGFASGPLLKVASSEGVKCVIQEQNSYPGITNKLLAPKVEKVFVAYDDLDRFFPKDKIVKTGNPVRQDLLGVDDNKEAGLKLFDLDAHKKTLLVLGGSLGARRINQLIERELEFFKAHDIQVIWQCGRFYYEEYKHYESESVKVLAFLNEMDKAYGAADVIISRAGASSVSELCIVGKPVIFIPSPNVAEDHQTKNAKSVADKGGALLINEKDLDNEFQQGFKALITSKDRMEELGVNIKKLALPDATKHIVDEIEIILNKN
ncbi:UDP-N-acetylglucosamine-N-acetylmuramylpentapeptide N-acetylglucosamine transferase [Zhouia amylolytica]|uniref:UDP-N-acetylglucosamine--N-acetylmuramyl-(pentapeptide) pyrophosphoryl-undecaprenol N-acetylglucosamine transferase n=2 Tax=Zhouia amylolytica TaxID=376730 RepID=W2ULU0_9FLAO|nr:undecaprenyldiphospho-muramoylpentapeptide beta-N-acetylglucosaminyltransferase [Zhouia amylolytica]ETN94988.1 undecaprenyldiphospho-muramoylpentapeptide beta-N-acetylglucosaminyltransferase [Zhouia amylolytica AD3]MCQ0110576.1 undecaprenyldiphospho-muramoylpentapeptide beta-N-acetylglucosaminyltransferase [Zhouia amylolytica]SFS64733.1 UDP-N-acetylglucosamine-N-acetylmuramylpentapeptide N-acetylglucosamine transferase [Zhouia amylolytica]